MNATWFDPNLYGWIPGTVFGLAAGAWGASVGLFARRGRGRGLILGAAWLLVACSAALLVVGVFAWQSGQPYGVWYGLGLPGVIGLVVLGGNIPTARRAYQDAERRQLEAHDLSL